MKSNLLSFLISIIVALLIFISIALADETVNCKSLDTREFGLISTGEIDEPWSEVKLIERYGPPCYIIDLGEVLIKRNRGRILELGPKTFQQDNNKIGTIAIKKQFIYNGNDSNRTSVFTIVDGVVVKKERIW